MSDKHGIKVRETPPPGSMKDPRDVSLGPVRSNAKDPGFPRQEAPVVEEKKRKL